MPKPVEGSERYVPALDGVRAVAVALVIGYHLGVPGMGGGLLGVGVFFTLSGFLITGVLLSTWHRTGRVGLGGFYLRRARRLLPAVVVLLVVVLLATMLVQPASLASVGPQAVGALLYVSNWQTIASGESYFERFAGPGPLDHLWSLAVEEQFYLVWPVLLLVLMAIPRVTLRVVAALTGLLAAGSFVLLWVVATPGFDNTRAYEGTDTRAGGLLVGAAVALLIWRPPGSRRVAGRRQVADRWALVGLVVIGALVTLTDEYSMFLYRGGLLALSLATVVVLAVVVQPGSRVGAALGWRPLAWVGERSYGIYLWHLPVIVLTPAEVLADAPAQRGSLLVGITIALAALSWTLVEDPIRRHGLSGAWQLGRFDRLGRPRRVPALLAGTAAMVLVATSALAVHHLVWGRPAAVAASAPLSLDVPPLPLDATAAPQSTDTPLPEHRPTTTPSPTTTAPLRTRCTELVHVGDSTSIGLMDPAYLPSREARIDAQYERVGVTRFTADISGARSIVERYQDFPNAEEAVRSRTDAGYIGCWALAMGVNEAANQYVGGVVPLDRRIDLLMRHIPAGTPVLWLTVKTLDSGGPYGDAQMQKWNAALVKACQRYPNMRVYDWRGEVKSSWYVPDNIHYTSKGYTQRAARIADALARAFPADTTADAPSPAACLVRSGR